MAPTIKWQRWESGSYDWFGQTASDALPALEAELDAWITTVNSNASNTGRQITKERGYADSTGGNYAGLVISMGANSNASKAYLKYACINSTTSRRIYLGDTFADNTSNGGYGTVSGGYSDTSVSWITSGQAANWVVTTGTVDGQEYFCFGPYFDSATNANYQDGFVIFKATDGEWSAASGDGSTSTGHIHYWDDSAGTGWENCSRGASASAADSVIVSSSYTYRRYSIVTNSSNTASSADVSTDGTRVVYAASPDMFNAGGSASIAYTATRRTMADLGDGDNVYIMSGYFYGPSFLVDLRP